MMPIAPIAFNNLPKGWIEERRETILREGFILRRSAAVNIEVRSLREDRWLRLPLPDKAPGFASGTDRDAALFALQRPHSRT